MLSPFSQEIQKPRKGPSVMREKIMLRFCSADCAEKKHLRETATDSVGFLLAWTLLLICQRDTARAQLAVRTLRCQFLFSNTFSSSLTTLHYLRTAVSTPQCHSFSLPAILSLVFWCICAFVPSHFCILLFVSHIG